MRLSHPFPLACTRAAVRASIALAACALLACGADDSAASVEAEPAAPAAPPAPAPAPQAQPEAPRERTADEAGQEPEPIVTDPVADDTAPPDRVVVGELSRFWTVCDDAVEARVKRHRIGDADEGPTVESRIEDGWVARAVEFLDDDDAFEGAWGCRGAQGGRVEVAYVTRVYALGVGPRFFYDPGPDTVEPANWLGQVVLAASPASAMAQRSSRRAALDRLAACTAPNGVPVTSGLFIAAQRLGRFGTPDAFYGWFVLPDTIIDGEVRDVVTLQRRGSTGPVAISFELGPDGCVPLDDAAVGAYQIAASIVRGERRLQIDGLSSDTSPSAVPDNASRALVYVLRQREQLRMLEDFLAFYGTNRAYASGGWDSLGPDEDGRYVVVHAFTVGREELQAAWSVDPRAGDVAPASALTGLLETVTPRVDTVRVLNAGDVARVEEGEGSGDGPGSETLSSEVIDARLAERQDEVIACYRYELARNRRPAGVEATWKVTGEGRAIDIEVTIDGPRSPAFEACFERFITGTSFPTFDGPPVDARTSFTFDRVD